MKEIKYSATENNHNVKNVFLDINSIGDVVSKETFNNIKEDCKTVTLKMLTLNETEDSTRKNNKSKPLDEPSIDEQSVSNNETRGATSQNVINNNPANSTKQLSNENSDSNGFYTVDPKNYFAASKDYIPIEYDPENRNYFVRRVCIITFVMLAVTSIIISVFHFVCAVMIATYAMYCSPCSRKPPYSIIWLTITTVCYSLVGICVTVQYNTEILFLAFMTTTTVVFVCTLLAFSKFDFSSWLIYLIAFVVASLTLSAIISIFTFILKINLKPLQIVMLITSTLVQCVLLIIELQMILGGKSIELHMHEYSLAAFMLYTSIIEIFLKMVQLLGAVANYI